MATEFTACGGDRVITDGEIADIVQTLIPSGGRVLDVGCGDGSTLDVLADRGVLGMGADPYAYGKSAPCRRLRAEEIGSLEEEFDVVYTVYSLHHFDDPRQFLREAKQVLSSTGVLLIVDWVEEADTGAWERYFSLEKVVQWVTEVGFDLLRREVRGQTMIVARRIKGEGAK